MTTHNSERRTLLRGMALLALSLAACQKKEGTVPQSQTPDAAAPAAPPPSQAGPASEAGGAPSAGAPMSGAVASGKISKAQAQYQDQPKGDQQCSTCTHFIAESSTCKVVEGKVSPNGWCMLWAKKA